MLNTRQVFFCLEGCAETRKSEKVQNRRAMHIILLESMVQSHVYQQSRRLVSNQ